MGEVEQIRQTAAVVGTGIAGLSMAYLLQEEGFDVSVYERHEEIGMDAHCVMVENKNDQLFRLNTPPRSFSREYYPRLMELYRISGVDIEPWSWAWGAFFVGSTTPYVRVFKKFRLFGFSLPSYVDLSRPLDTLRIWMDAYRFSSACARDIDNEELCSMTFGEYCTYLGLSDCFLEQALLPTLSMVCTCSYEACMNYPAELIMEFYAKTATYGQYRTKNGTQDAVSRLTKNLKKINVGVEVKKVWKAGCGPANPQQQPGSTHKPRIEYVKSNGEVVVEAFDHIVMATQANHAVRLLQDLSPEHKSVLESFEHETSQVVIHRDERVMPANGLFWSPMSVGVRKDRSASMFTIWMNDSFPQIKGNLFQTWNPVIDIDEALVVDKPITFERPIMTKQSVEAVSDLESKFQGVDGIWFCGAWLARRIPLQESGVVSALQVLKRITGREPHRGDWSEKANPSEDNKIAKVLLGLGVVTIVGLALIRK